MALYVDKYRPTSLDKLDYHPDLTDQFKKMAAVGDFPHMLVYGPSGAGKKTRIMAVLKEIYGPAVEKLKIDMRTFATPSNKKIEINIVSSNYHMEITPSDVGSNDRLVIQELIKEVAQTQQVDSSAKRSFKVVILNEADTLSKNAQHALRRTMEKYMNNLRVIICANSTSRIIGPIRSRCLLVRVAAPSNDEIKHVMTKVAIKEGLQIPDAFASRIATLSNGNLRKALLMLESAKVRYYPFMVDQPIPLTDWENYIHETARVIVEEQTPKRLQDVRGRLYELLTHCIAPEVILKTLMFDIIKLIDVGMAPEVVKMAADYEQGMRQGTKPIFHLEAFVAKFMALYKRFLFDLMNE
ncbi:Subunit of heteropentameric Replication factor C (RF-C) [Podochytrium sp. JEL0797]|nr:Subunit of heteropentameric Replication factor C (RF-C) [Podochytrium sp. JEL0797]